MNQNIKKLYGAALVCLGVAYAANASTVETPTIYGKSFFNQRSQGSNVARWMAGESHLRYVADTDCINGVLSITPEYGQTFRGSDIAKYLSFNGTNSMVFAGPRTALVGNAPVAANATTDVFARNFLLNDDFRGTLTLNPLVRNFVLDINFYLGLDEWVQGLWFEIDVPVNWTSWQLRLSEVVTSTGISIQAGALGNTLQASSNLSSIITAVDGQLLNPALPAVTEKLAFARINNDKHRKTSVADVTLILGYNFWLSECGHFGIQAAVIAPTGTRPNGQYLFEPVVGNGKHVEVGGGITGHYELWNNGCDQSFGIYMEGYAYHMFRAKQKRTFDITGNGIGSRYLLLKRFTGVTPLASADQVVFGPNVTTLDCKVKNDVHGDAAIMFDYKNCGFTFDVGYNVWGRTKDKITITGTIPANTFGVQGSTLSAAATTQSLSQVNGTFLPTGATDAVTLTAESLDADSAAHPSAFSHKVFAHFGYTWENCDYMPFLGVGGEAEFSGKKYTAFNQWGVWVKGGFSFA